MTATRIRHAVKIVSKDEIPENMNTVLSVPLYTVKAELLKCTDYDTARAVFRNNKPSNIKSDNNGLFVKSVNVGVSYEPIGCDIDIVTFDGDKIFLTEHAQFIGMTDKCFYAKDTDGNTRQIKRDNSFIILSD